MKINRKKDKRELFLSATDLSAITKYFGVMNLIREHYPPLRQEATDAILAIKPVVEGCECSPTAKNHLAIEISEEKF